MGDRVRLARSVVYRQDDEVIRAPNHDSGTRPSATRELDLSDVFCLKALWSLAHFKFNQLTLVE
jgi:hypothetical protein